MAVPLDMESVKELKQKIKLARNKELSFALALGKKPEDCALIMHKERGGDKLLLQVKKIEGVQPQKSCYGSLTVDGQLVKLACRSDPPAGLVKNFRIFFRSNGIAMKLAVLAPGETEFKLDPEDAAEAEAPAASPAPQDSGAAETESDAPPAPAASDKPDRPDTWLSEAETEALQARIDAVKDALGGLEGAILDKIAEGHRRAQMLVVEGDGARAAGAKAAKLLEQLEKALTQIAQAAAKKPAPQEAPQEQAAPDPAEARWQESFAKLDPHVRRALAAGHGDIAKIQTIWSYAQEKASAGNFAVALKAVGQLASLLSQAAEAAKRARAAEVAGADNSQIKAAWDGVMARYAPVVASLGGGQDPRAPKIQAAWDMAVAAAQAADFDKANMIVGRLRPVLDAAPAPTAAPEPKSPKAPSAAPGETGPEAAPEGGAEGEPETASAGDESTPPASKTPHRWQTARMIRPKNRRCKISTRRAETCCGSRG